MEAVVMGIPHHRHRHQIMGQPVGLIHLPAMEVEAIGKSATRTEVPSSQSNCSMVCPELPDQWAIQRYDDAPIAAFQQNVSLYVMGFFEFFDGDPEGLEQASEEQVNIWEVLAQNEGITLSDKVVAALNSPNEAVQLEGQLGAIIQDNSELIQFQQKFGWNGVFGEIDAESPDAIFEAKSGGLKNLMPTLRSQFTNRITNPDGKPFVIITGVDGEK